MLQELNWTTLSEHRSRSKASLLYKALHKLIELPTEQLAKTLGQTRHWDNFFIPFARTVTYRQSYYLTFNCSY